MTLSQEQQHAVDASGHCVVVACPGSGKTRVLVERAIRLRERHPTAAIIVVTFTRQAAAELRRRLADKVATLARMRVATFHSLALQQVLSGHDSRICVPDEKVALLRVAAQQHLPDKSFREFLKAADAYTSGHSAALDQPEFQAAYDTYIEVMAEHSAIDFGQGILRAVESMESGTLSPIDCDYLLVDEVQDIDPTQVRWVTAHTDAGAELTVVGDDDQAIYAFRNSLGYRGMRSISDRLRATVIKLSTNYRSHDEVLGLSVRLIEHNRNRVPKDLYSARGPGGSVRLYDQAWTDEDEALQLVTTIRSSPGKWAIMARTNRKLDLVCRQLKEAGIEFTRPGQTSFWESEEPAFFLRLLQPNALQDPLLRARVEARAGQAPRWGKGTPGSLNSLAALLRGDPVTSDPKQRIDGVASWLTSNVRGVPKARIEGVIGVTERCRDYLREIDGNILSIIQQAKRPRSTKEEDVLVLTMHSAKGREFPKVWIFGCQEGTIPSSKADDLEEERRLMYVAMTRAEDQLHLSFAWNQVVHQADGGTHLRKLTPSQFLTMDMGLPIAERRDVEAANP